MKVRAFVIETELNERTQLITLVDVLTGDKHLLEKSRFPATLAFDRLYGNLDENGAPETVTSPGCHMPIDFDPDDPRPFLAFSLDYIASSNPSDIFDEILPEGYCWYVEKSPVEKYLTRTFFRVLDTLVKQVYNFRENTLFAGKDNSELKDDEYRVIKLSSPTNLFTIAIFSDDKTGYFSGEVILEESNIDPNLLNRYGKLLGDTFPIRDIDDLKRLFTDPITYLVKSLDLPRELKVKDLLELLEGADPEAVVEIPIYQYNKRYPVCYQTVEFSKKGAPSQPFPDRFRIEISLPTTKDEYKILSTRKK
jgi:hypothetical protein